MNEQQQQALTAGLKALAERTRDAAASSRVEEALLEEIARRHDHAPPAVAKGTPRAFVALAAGLLLAVGVSVWFGTSGTPPRDAAFTRPADFVELPGAAVLPEMESASIVRISLPPSALPQYGVAIAPEMTGTSVEAELLVAQDGQPRAIRLVKDSDSQRSSP
jgi:hypothetical protein